ncbi:Fc.00g094000.m01.CDS01 [Cosmosporella sp. VM-42]
MPPGRRKKACDLCFTKKIKCDAREPQCSNCILYGAECRQSIIRHRANPPNLRPRSSLVENTQQERILETIGSSADNLGESPNSAVESTNRAQDEALLATPLIQSTPRVIITRNVDQGRGDDKSWRFDPLHPSLYYGPRDEHLRLPPLDDIMPIIDLYFNVVNTYTPLFNHSSFMKMITGWFNVTSRRDATSGAAILMVVCLGLQSLSSGHEIHLEPSEITHWIEYSLRNAQSTIPELLATDEDLSGVQVLVALALSFRQARDLKPASILIGMAVRSAHRMQLHSADSAKYFIDQDVQQRSKVFWIIYMLDKDLSLRLKVPSILSDNNISISFPSHTSLDESGFLSTKDGCTTLNIFRHRVELARLEGKVYDLLYSHSMNVDDSQRRQRVTLLQHTLDKWYAEIPTVFRSDEVSKNVGQSELLQIAKLHHAHLLCLVCIHGVWSEQAPWMRSLSSLSRAAVSDIAEAIQGPKVSACYETQTPPLWDGWNQCVAVSRLCMKLLQSVEPTESLIWHNLCPHFTGIIVLLSNIIIQPMQVSHLEDVQLAAGSRQIYNQIFQDLRSPLVDSLKQITKDLDTKATAAMVEARFEQITETQPMFFAGDVEREIYEFANNPLLELNPDNLAAGSGEDMMASYFTENHFPTPNYFS